MGHTVAALMQKVVPMSKTLPLIAVGFIGVASIAAAIFWRSGGSVEELTYGAVGRIEQFRVQSDLCLNVDGGCQEIDQQRDFFMGNFIQTRTDGMIDAALSDGTRLTLGPESSAVVDEFIFDPERPGRLKISILQGAMRMVTGGVGEMEEKDVTVDMPVGSLGVRGTDFWVGQIDGAFSVLLLDGEVLVSTDIGSVTLDEPGQGVALSSRDAAPGPVKNWPAEKRDRALAAVTF